jgi:hypothetical protein
MSGISDAARSFMLPAIKVLAGEMGLPEGNWESLLPANRDLHLRFNSGEGFASLGRLRIGDVYRKR